MTVAKHPKHFDHKRRELLSSYVANGIAEFVVTFTEKSFPVSTALIAGNCFSLGSKFSRYRSTASNYLASYPSIFKKGATVVVMIKYGNNYQTRVLPPVFFFLAEGDWWNPEMVYCWKKNEKTKGFSLSHKTPVLVTQAERSVVKIHPEVYRTAQRPAAQFVG